MRLTAAHSQRNLILFNLKEIDKIIVNEKSVFLKRRERSVKKIDIFHLLRTKVLNCFTHFFHD